MWSSFIMSCFSPLLRKSTLFLLQVADSCSGLSGSSVTSTQSRVTSVVSLDMECLQFLMLCCPKSKVVTTVKVFYLPSCLDVSCTTRNHSFGMGPDLIVSAFLWQVYIYLRQARRRNSLFKGTNLPIFVNYPKISFMKKWGRLVHSSCWQKLPYRRDCCVKFHLLFATFLLVKAFCALSTSGKLVIAGD